MPGFVENIDSYSDPPGHSGMEQKSPQRAGFFCLAGTLLPCQLVVDNLDFVAYAIGGCGIVGKGAGFTRFKFHDDLILGF